MDKAIEIFNMQNSKKINKEKLLKMVQENQQYLVNKYVCVKGEYLVSAVILVAGNFDEVRKLKKGKPYYIPKKDELLKYIKFDYFEVNNEYQDLMNYLKKMFFFKSKAKRICQNILINCQSINALQDIPQILADNNIKIRNTRQFNKLMSLIQNLARNTRVWYHNGFTANEIEKMME